VLIVVCVLAAAIATAAAMFADISKTILFVLAACFGGIALTLYSLSLSHINDHLDSKQIVSASASVILMNGAGSMVGPLLIATLMGSFGPSAYFASLAALAATLGLYAIWRKGQRAAVPSEQKFPFVTAQPQAVAGQMIADIAQHQQGSVARDDTH
jgi:MFS family permease